MTDTEFAIITWAKKHLDQHFTNPPLNHIVEVMGDAIAFTGTFETCKCGRVSRWVSLSISSTVCSPYCLMDIWEKFNAYIEAK